MVSLFVHVIFGVCLLLSIGSKKESAQITEPVVTEDYEDHIEPMFNQEDK